MLLAHGIFTDAINQLNIGDSLFVHPTWYGTGMGQIDTKSTLKSGQPNPDFVPSKVLTNSVFNLRQAISSTWKAMSGSPKFQLVVLFLWADRVESTIITHCQVLLVQREGGVHKCEYI